jgi:hypothetical protein
LLLGTIGTLVVAADFETPPKLEAGKILSAEVLEGAHHHVESEVVNDGYMNTYSIASDFGRFGAYGTLQLVIRLREIGALAELAELSKSEVYANAVKEGALRGVKAVGTIADKPVETIKGVPQGVKKLFGRTKRAVEGGYETAKGLAADDKGEEGEEGQEGEEGDQKSRTEKAGEAGSAYAKKYLGVNAAERRWSQKLGVDPYSDNKALKKAIKEVAKVDSAGRFTVRLAPIPKIPGSATITQVNSLIWTMDGYELMQFNRNRLIEAGAAPEAIDAFYENVFFSPTRQTVLFTALLSLGGTENIGQALSQASSAESEHEARFFVTSTQMLAWFHKNESPIVRLLPGMRALVAVADDGRLVFVAPVDYLSWTAEVAAAGERLAAEASSGNGRREVWLLGETSARCRAGLESQGWTLQTGVGEQLFAAAKAAKEASADPGSEG